MNALNNHVQLIGNLGRDVDFKSLDNGKARAQVSLATKNIYKGKDGERQIETQWHHLVGWGKVAEMMQVFLKKGSSVVIQGRLNTQARGTGKNKRIFAEVVVNEFRLLQ